MRPHITYTQRPQQQTRIILDLTVEEATALYWAIDTGNAHMRSWVRPGYREVFSETAQEIEGEIHARLIDTLNDPDRYSQAAPDCVTDEPLDIVVKIDDVLKAQSPEVWLGHVLGASYYGVK